MLLRSTDRELVSGAGDRGLNSWAASETNMEDGTLWDTNRLWDSMGDYGAHNSSLTVDVPAAPRRPVQLPPRLDPHARADPPAPRAGQIVAPGPAAELIALALI